MQGFQRKIIGLGIDIVGFGIFQKFNKIIRCFDQFRISPGIFGDFAVGLGTAGK